MKAGPMPDDTITVADNEAARQFEAQVDGQLARLVYERTPDRIALIHTEVADALEGRGIGSRLVRFALDDARARRLRVVPRCPFVRAFIERRPEYRELVTRRLSADC
jgi:predicted GNAT family acetyltransferase